MTDATDGDYPSFKRSIQASIDRYREEKSSPRSVAIKLLNTKKYSKLFVKSLGIPVAETLGLHLHVNDVDFDALPDHVVLKPQWVPPTTACSSWSVPVMTCGGTT